MTKLRKKGPTGKRGFNTDGKKSITGLEEIAVYKTAFQRASVGILKLKKLKEELEQAPAGLKKPNPSHLLIELRAKQESQTRKIHLEKNLAGPVTQMSRWGGLTSENALQTDLDHRCKLGPNSGQ